ncbi:MAG TPA: VOC family protein [Ignavibacteriaceae bacterium]|nr:VOC family protein [Ignavibacteriaceae bacterium]
MNRVVHFEIAAEQPDRATKFYSDIFGWQINKWEGPMPYWLIKTGEQGETGIDGAIFERKENWPTIVNTIEVASVDDFNEKIKKAGGEVVTPKDAIPGVGYMSYCRDTEGNIFGIMQNDPNAK